MNSNSSALIVPPRSTATSVTNELRDIRPPIELPNEWAWLWLGIAVAVLLAGGLLGWLWWRKKRTEVKPVLLVPAHVRARNKLSGALALLQDPKLFCSLVSDTLRVYLEERFNFHAPERTTEEFLLELHGTPLLNVDQKQRLTEFLEQCDLVKFARFEPTETELRALLEAALRLIDETYQVGIPATSTNSAPPSVPPPPSLPPSSVGVGAEPPPVPSSARPATVTLSGSPQPPNSPSRPAQ